MSRTTGENIDDLSHLEQSIIDILTTPIGSRIAVRDYGSNLPDIVDKTINRQWVIDAFAYIAEALARFEPRFLLSQVLIDASNIVAGQLILRLTGLYKPLGRVVVLENVTLDFGAQTIG